MKKLILLLGLLLTGAITQAQFTAIPDSTFEYYLIYNGLDNVEDGQVLTANITGVTALNLNGAYISDMTGIQAFSSLQSLDLYNNNLNSLNVSGLTNLVYLNCAENNLTSLNLSGLTNLNHVDCAANLITNINLTGVNLTILKCQNNQLTSLSVSSCTNLTELYFPSNNLTTINLSGLTNLTIFNSTFNPNLSCIQVNNVAAANANYGWDKDGTAGYSTNCGLIIPTTKVRLNQCGATLATLNSPIKADIVSGVQMYRFEATNGSNVRTFETVKVSFTLTKLIGSTYGTTYGIRVAVKMGGIWGNYGASCNITTPSLVSSASLPTTSLRTTDCGATLATLGTPIHSKLVYNASAYRFEITNGTSISTFETPIYYFFLTDMMGSTYGTTYSIRVQTYVENVWSNYGTSCNVTTPILLPANIPTTQIRADFCGTSLASLNTKIPATLVYGAEGYRFEITTGGTTTTYDSSLYLFRLVDAGVVVANGLNYEIRVAAKVNGVYGAYGASCTISTIPTTRLADEFCNGPLDNLDTQIYPNPVLNAQAYRFQIYSYYGSNVFEAPLSFKLSDAIGVQNFATYTIKVAAKVNGAYGVYGVSCNVYTGYINNPNPWDRSKESNITDLKISAYPNPSNTAFKIQVDEANNETISLLVFDMMGRQIENKVVEASDIENLTLGQNYATGIYNVMVTQGANNKTLRLIKN
jgi:hypothetical protein